MAATLQTTTTVTQEVILKPSVRRRLLVEFKAYQALKAQVDALEEKMNAHKAAAGLLREGTDQKSLSLDGFKITKVTGTTKKLDKNKLCELGCALAWIEEATTEKPKKPYELITCPGETEKVYE